MPFYVACKKERGSSLYIDIVRSPKNIQWKKNSQKLYILMCIYIKWEKYDAEHYGLCYLLYKTKGRNIKPFVHIFLCIRISGRIQHKKLITSFM